MRSVILIRFDNNYSYNLWLTQSFEVDVSKTPGSVTSKGNPEESSSTASGELSGRLGGIRIHLRIVEISRYSQYFLSFL